MGKRDGEKQMWERDINWVPVYNWGPNQQPRHVPWPSIKPATFQFAGWQPTKWATSVRAQLSLLKLNSVKELKVQLQAPASRAQLVGALSRASKDCGLIPSQGIYLGCGFNPWSGHVVSLSQINKHILGWGFKKSITVRDMNSDSEVNHLRCDLKTKDQNLDSSLVKRVGLTETKTCKAYGFHERSAIKTTKWARVGVVQLAGVSSCRTKGLKFDSWSGNMARFWVLSLVVACIRRQPIDVSLFLPSSPSKSNEKKKKAMKKSLSED